MTDSYPTPARIDEWTVRWETEDDQVVDPGEIMVWALCGPEPIGPQ